MEEINVIGGARIGIVNATWPFARLAVSPVQLKLTCVLDCYEFLPKDVVSLRPYGALPFFYSGIRILHARRDYPSKIIFWCPSNPETLISEIRDAGFLPTAPAGSEIRWRGIPLRWSAIILFILNLERTVPSQCQIAAWFHEPCRPIHTRPATLRILGLLGDQTVARTSGNDS